jgi:hypothetical protein
MFSLDTAIVATLAYSQVFSYPLTLDELHSRLIKTDESVSKKEIEKKVRGLKQFELVDGLIVPTAHPEQAAIRRDREAFSKGRWSEVDDIAKLLRKIPWISGMYVTGSLAVNNCISPDDDIDLLIITDERRLWLTRLVVVGLTALKGKYRFHTARASRGWCFNMWLEETSVAVPPQQRSLYTAYEVVQAQPINFAQPTQSVNRVQNVLNLSNNWINEYLMYPDLQSEGQSANTRRKTGGNGGWVGSGVLGGLNYLAYLFQRLYMRPHQTIERVSYSAAFFHPRNTGKWVEERFAKLVKEYGVKEDVVDYLFPN